MNRNTLTIVITNIPDRQMKVFWEAATAPAPKNFKPKRNVIHIESKEETRERIEIDYEYMNEINPKMLNNDIAGLYTLSMVEQFDREFGKPK